MFRSINFSHLLRRRVVKILPMHGVSAIGLKLLGLEASSTADPLAISLIAAVFHWWGTAEWAQQKLKMSTSAGMRAGHFLNTTYPILSNGDGVEAAFIFFMTLKISEAVKGEQSIWTSGGGGEGIQSGWMKLFGSA